MKKEVNICFVKSPHYRLLPANGVWGGPSPTGDIVLDFFIDLTAPPGELTLLVDESGGMPTEKARSEQKTIRELQVGVVLRADIALAIGNFIIEKANMVIKRPAGPVQ